MQLAAERQHHRFAARVGQACVPAAPSPRRTGGVKLQDCAPPLRPAAAGRRSGARAEFAATINPHVYPPALAALLEEECELADHILVGSSFVRDSFIAEGIDPNKLTAIPYGTDTSLFVPGAEAQKRWQVSSAVRRANRTTKGHRLPAARL